MRLILNIQQGHVRHEVLMALAVCSLSHLVNQPQFSSSWPLLDCGYGHGIDDIGIPLGPGPTAFLHNAGCQEAVCGIQIGPFTLSQPLYVPRRQPCASLTWVGNREAICLVAALEAAIWPLALAE